jgi:uncharacterized protein
MKARSTLSGLRSWDARQLDFLDGCRLFDGRPIFTAPSPRSGEQRWVSLGEFNGEMIAVVWTRRGTRHSRHHDEESSE